jgi:hypothetical protein
MRERLLGLLPPYAREVLDVATFRRVMRLADPSRFLAELDRRFAAIKARLLPIRPAELAAELDATFAALLNQVMAIDITASLTTVRQSIERVKATASLLRVDHLAPDIERGVNDLRRLIEGLNPLRLVDELDGLHAGLIGIVERVRPAVMLAGLQARLAEVQALLRGLAPGQVLTPALTAAWQAVTALLAEVDFGVILAPLLERLDQLEAALWASLERTETAFDGMLGAARTVLGGGVGGGAEVSL